MPGRFHLIMAAGKILSDDGFKVEYRRHYPMPYEPDKVTPALLTDAGPVTVVLAWEAACKASGASEEQTRERLIELCRESDELCAYN